MSSNGESYIDRLRAMLADNPAWTGTAMSSTERDALVRVIDDALQEWCGDSSARHILADAVLAAGFVRGNSPALYEQTMQAVIDRAESAERELRARELHHFESEKAMEEALNTLNAASVPLGMTEAQFYASLMSRARVILRDATA